MKRRALAAIAVGLGGLTATVLGGGVAQALTPGPHLVVNVMYRDLPDVVRLGTVDVIVPKQVYDWTHTPAGTPVPGMVAHWRCTGEATAPWETSQTLTVAPNGAYSTVLRATLPVGGTAPVSSCDVWVETPAGLVTYHPREGGEHDRASVYAFFDLAQVVTVPGTRGSEY